MPEKFISTSSGIIGMTEKQKRRYFFLSLILMMFWTAFKSPEIFIKINFFFRLDLPLFLNILPTSDLLSIYAEDHEKVLKTLHLAAYGVWAACLLLMLPFLTSLYRNHLHLKTGVCPAGIWCTTHLWWVLGATAFCHIAPLSIGFAPEKDLLVASPVLLVVTSVVLLYRQARRKARAVQPDAATPSLWLLLCWSFLTILLVQPILPFAEPGPGALTLSGQLPLWIIPEPPMSVEIPEIEFLKAKLRVALYIVLTFTPGFLGYFLFSSIGRTQAIALQGLPNQKKGEG